MRPTHSGRLARWLGEDAVARLSEAGRDWYGPPIAVAGVPGGVHVAPGGDLVGPIRGGGYASVLDYARDRMQDAARRVERQRRAQARVERFGAGFASLSELIAEATAGKRRDYYFQKVGTSGTVAGNNTLWYVGNLPDAGAVASAAPGGIAPDATTTGALHLYNAPSGDTQHLVRMDVVASVGGNQLMLYDRLFSVAKTMSSSATEAVTGVPTRYQSVTNTDADYAGGNFLFIECSSGLSNTAHNWTTCTYTDQDGNTGATLPSVTGNQSNGANRLDHPVGRWFCPLAVGDTGIKALTQMQCSSATVTGAIDFTIGHPIAFVPCPVANFMFVLDGLNSAFNLARIFDDACLALLEITKSAATATNYTGSILTVSS